MPNPGPTKRKSYTFVWSPEGRPLMTVRDDNYQTWTRKQAVTEFKKRFPSYAKYMGEVYIEEKTWEE